MSADNWGVCPRCVENAIKEGKAPPSDEDEGQTTLREDYEILTTPDGRLVIDYEAYCEICHFNFSARCNFPIDLRKDGRQIALGEFL
jgi:hypothetical protein